MWKMQLFIILLLYLVMDFIWIYSNFRMYNNSVMKIQNKPIAFRMTPAIIAYGLLVLNIVYILIPLTKKLSNIKRSLVFAISGLVIYGVYNATTYAIIENYPLHVAIIDTLWGLISHLVLSLMISFLHK
jgi:uncharacterized membrane protein